MTESGPGWEPSDLDELEAMVDAGFAPGVDDARELLATVRDLERRREDALLHYRIGEETEWGALPVDWRYVARQMAVALEWDDDDPDDPRGRSDAASWDRKAGPITEAEDGKA